MGEDHVAVINRLLHDPAITGEGAFSLAFATLAHRYDLPVSEAQMLALSRCSSILEGQILADSFWPELDLVFR